MTITPRAHPTFTCIHSQRHSHKNIHTFTHIDTHTHIHTCARTHSHSLTQTHTHINKIRKTSLLTVTPWQRLITTHTHTHTNTYISAKVHTYTYIRVTLLRPHWHINIRTPLYALAYACTQPLTHTPTHACTYASLIDTQIHTHTHTPILYIYIYIYIYSELREQAWRSFYRLRKWRWRSNFKFWSRLHFILCLGMVWRHPFFLISYGLAAEHNKLFEFKMATSQAERKLWI